MCQLIVRYIFLGASLYSGLYNTGYTRSACTYNVRTHTHKLRDPFNLPRKSRLKTEECIKLLGIIQSKPCDNGRRSAKFGAVLEFNGKTETVFVHDNFFGFKVLNIKSTSILLARGKCRKTLYIE